MIIDEQIHSSVLWTSPASIITLGKARLESKTAHKEDIYFLEDVEIETPACPYVGRTSGEVRSSKDLLLPKPIYLKGCRV